MGSRPRSDRRERCGVRLCPGLGAVTGRRATVDVNGADLFANLTVTCGLVAVMAGLLLLSARAARLRAVLAAVTWLGGLTAAGLTVYVATSDQWPS